MRKSITLSTLKNELMNFDITPESKEYVVGLTLLAGLQVGPSADAIASFINHPRSVVREIGKRLRKNGVWIGNKTCCGWFEKDGGVAFMLDCFVGMGWMERSKSHSK